MSLTAVFSCGENKLQDYRWSDDDCDKLKRISRLIEGTHRERTDAVVFQKDSDANWSVLLSGVRSVRRKSRDREECFTMVCWQELSESSALALALDLLDHNEDIQRKIDEYIEPTGIVGRGWEPDFDKLSKIVPQGIGCSSITQIDFAGTEKEFESVSHAVAFLRDRSFPDLFVIQGKNRSFKNGVKIFSPLAESQHPSEEGCSALPQGDNFPSKGLRRIIALSLLVLAGSFAFYSLYNASDWGRNRGHERIPNQLARPTEVESSPSQSRSEKIEPQKTGDGSNEEASGESEKTELNNPPKASQTNDPKLKKEDLKK